MHILFVADGDDRYGAPHSLLQMVSEIIKLDHSIIVSVVLTKKSSIATAFADLGCNVYKISYSPFYQSISTPCWKMIVKYPLHGIQYLYGRLFGIWLLQRKLDLASVDIIHANSTREDFGAILAQKYSKPLFWHIREFGDLDYSCYSYRKDYINLMNRTTYMCIAISDAVREHWIKKGIDPNKIKRNYNGVDTDVKVKTRYNSDDRCLVRFLFIGRLTETKGQRQLIEAVGLLPSRLRKQISIDVVGDGRRRYCSELKRKIEELGLDAVIIMKGYQKDIYKDIADYDCGIMCSRSEGFGRVTAEYMMAGLPVIASDTGANPELVKDGETGLLYKQGDVADLTEKLTIMLNHPELREQMGRNAAKFAHENLTAQKNAKFIYEEYLKILK